MELPLPCGITVIELSNFNSRSNIINSISPNGKYKAFYKDAKMWDEDYINKHK